MQQDNKRLGLLGWFKARRLERQLRRRWREDAGWRESVQATVRKEVAKRVNKK